MQWAALGLAQVPTRYPVAYTELVQEPTARLDGGQSSGRDYPFTRPDINPREREVQPGHLNKR